MLKNEDTRQSKMFAYTLTIKHPLKDSPFTECICLVWQSFWDVCCLFVGNNERGCSAAIMVHHVDAAFHDSSSAYFCPS